jgi:hypothetical protein
MFRSATLMVDTIQNGKLQFIKNHIKNPLISNAWTNFVNKQSDFCHSIIDLQIETVTESSKAISETTLGKMMNPFGIDWFAAGWDARVNRDLKENKSK